MHHFALTIALSVLTFSTAAAATPVREVAALIAAVRAAPAGSVIELAEGTFALGAPLEVPAGVTVKGAGIGRTILTHTPEWKAATDTLPDPETNQAKFDRSGYLIRLAPKAADITLTGLTLTGPQLHGAVFGSGNANVRLHDLRIADFLYCGVRSYSWKGAKIHDCTFVDTGMRWSEGQPGLQGGTVGGGIFAIWIADSEIWNNRFLRTRTAPHEHSYGIKGRQARRCRIHHNTIEVNFSIELPFESDADVEIDHNVLHGTVSIPKHSGGPVPESGRTFHIHHNLFRNSYSIEFVRNGVEIDHNLFDFDAREDHGHLISGFGQATAPGPASFHHNLVSNPGRGVLWIREVFHHLDIHHNHIIARPTKTPRLEGLFGFNPECDFTTIRIADNVIECQGPPRPLLRHDRSAGAVIENNRLIGISDTARYANAPADRPPGPGAPLRFACGVSGETQVDDWKVTTPPGASTPPSKTGTPASPRPSRLP